MRGALAFAMSVEVGIQHTLRAAAAPQEKDSLGTGLPRFIEVVLAVLGMLVFAPVLALAAISVRLTSPGPGVFRQRRMGRRGQIFTLYKLRTMQLQHEGHQVTFADDNRVTSVGRFLRKTKLDELPQLWNVLKGDISLVGPRPEVPLYIDLENPMWQRVLEVKPGITDPMTWRLRNEEKLLAEVTGDREHFYLKFIWEEGKKQFYEIFKNVQISCRYLSHCC